MIIDPQRTVFNPHESYRNAADAAVTRWQRAWLVALMDWHQGNVSAAARGADMDRKWLGRLLVRHGLRGAR